MRYVPVVYALGEGSNTEDCSALLRVESELVCIIEHLQRLEKHPGFSNRPHCKNIPGLSA